MKNKTILILISLVILILAIMSGFIKTNKTHIFPCLFLAQAEWSVHMDDPEKLYMELTRNDKNLVDRFSCFHFSRPDLVHFKLLPNITFGTPIRAGQVIAQIHSKEDEYRIETIKAELEQTRAELQMLKVGEKIELQQEAEQELEYARAQIKAYKPQLERKKEMYNSSLISIEELELAEATFRLLQINAELQTAKLKATQTGEKPEYIQYIQTELEGFEKQYSILEMKNQAKQITSPVSGIVSDGNKAGLVCQVNKTDTLIVKIPVSESLIGRVKTDQKIKIALPYNNYESRECQILEIGNQAHFINGQSIFYLLCSIANPENIIKTGSTGIAKINFGPVPLYQRFIEQWNNYKVRKLTI